MNTILIRQKPEVRAVIDKIDAVGFQEMKDERSMVYVQIGMTAYNIEHDTIEEGHRNYKRILTAIETEGDC